MEPYKLWIEYLIIELDTQGRANKNELFRDLPAYFSMDSHADDIHIDESGKLVVQSGFNYTIRELADGRFCVDSQTVFCSAAICSFLNEKNIKYKMKLNISFRIGRRLEDIANVYLKRQPTVPISRDMIMNVNTHYTNGYTDFQFIFTQEDLQKNLTPIQIMLEALDSIDETYSIPSGCYEPIFIDKDEILSISFKNERDIQCHLSQIIDLFYINDTPSANLYRH